MEGYSGNYSLHDGGQAVGEVMFDGNGTPTLYAFDGFGASGLEWRSFPALSSGGYSAYTYDPQGSVVQPVTLYPSASGGPPSLRVRTSSSYDGFGLGVTAPADGSGMADPVDPVGFGGQHGYYHDYTTGLYLLTHRYYDAGAGRFVSRDALGYKGGINLYGFAGNNPINESDPSGFAPPTKGPFGEPITTSDLYTHHPDTNHPNLHYDYKIPADPNSANPNERKLREYRFDPQNNRWQEKQKSRKSAAARRYRAANLAVNAEERVLKGSMSKVNKANFYRTLFARWGQKILRYIPDVPGPLAVFDFIPSTLYDGSTSRRAYWQSKHPHQQYYEGVDGA